MAYTIPDQSAATYPYQAMPDPGDFTALAQAHLQSGVISGCGVAQRGAGANMSVDVASGVVLSLGKQMAVSATNVAISSNGTSNPRIDIIVVPSGGTPTVRLGSAAATPLFPALTAGDIPLAAVSVPASAASILNANIVSKAISQLAPLEIYVNGAFDGVTDDTAAWTAAAAAAAAAGAGVLVAGIGTSLVTKILITSSNTRIRGFGRGVSIIKEKSGGNRTPVVFNGSGTLTNVGISDLTIDGNVANQTILSVNYGGTGWTSTYGSAFSEQFGLSGAQFVDCIDVDVHNVAVQNGMNYGLSCIGCSGLDISHNWFINATQMRTRQSVQTTVGANTISITSNSGLGVRKGIRVVANDITGVADVGIDVHGMGANYVSVASNVIYGQQANVVGTNGSAYWGIALEMESADTLDNIGASVTGNYVADLNIAYIANNNLNTSHTILNQSWTGNTAHNCGSLFQPGGQWITFSGNTGYAMGSGISIAQITVNNLNAYWEFIGNTIEINVDGFGTTGFLMRVQNSAYTVRDVTIANNTVTGVLGTNGYHAGVVLEANFSGCTLSRVKVSNNKFINMAEGVMVLQTTGTVSQIQCIDNDIHGMTDAAYGFTGGSPATIVRGGDVTGNTNTNPMLGGSTPTSALARISGVKGYNDTLVSTALTPTTGAYTNTAHRDATYTVLGGTVSSITIGGAATGKTSGDFLVPAGQAFVVNNTVIPTTFRQILY